MFGRISKRAISTSARCGCTTGLRSVATSEATELTASRVTRCLKKSFLRNFPAEDVFDYVNNPLVQQRRWLGTSVLKTAPVATKLKRVNDGYYVDPELATRYVVRPATSSDCGDIMRLIHGLAEWEGNADHVEITEEDLRKDGFGERPLYQCVLLEAYEDDEVSSVIGYAMFTNGYCAWKGRTVTWEDLFVHRDYRGKGLGAVLLHEVCKFGFMDGCRDIGGYVDFENERAKQWYEDCGFENQTEQHGYNIMSMGGSTLVNYVRNHRPIDKLMRRGIHVESLVEK